MNELTFKRTYQINELHKQNLNNLLNTRNNAIEIGELLIKQKKDSLPPKNKPKKITILIVEDEKLVRKLACKILMQEGYNVLAASNGREAYTLSKQYKGKISLLISDIVMPGMNGPELAKKLTVKRPKLKVIYISGYANVAIFDHNIFKKGKNFIQKPFTPDILLNKVEVILS